MSNKKILFIILPYIVDTKKVENVKTAKIRSFKAFPYGVLSIASYIKKKNNAIVKIYDCNGQSKDEYLLDINNILKDFNPDVTGISLMFDNSYQYLQEILISIKTYNSKITTLLGGQATATSYLDIIKDISNLDAICHGEGEYAFSNFLETNIFTKEWVTITNKNPLKAKVNNLDSVIDIDYSLIDVKEYTQMEEAFSPFMKCDLKERNQFFMVSTRGCPFRCSFCMNSLDTDKKVRLVSVDKIIEHVEYLITNYNMNILTFYDDQILYNKDRAKQLFKKLADYNLRIEMPNGISVAYIDEELADLMWKAGVDTLYLAIESGSDYVIKKLIHKPINLKKVPDIIKILRKYNYWILGYFVTGMPTETDEHRKETVQYIKDIGLDWVSFSLASPVRGSQLYNECIEKGYIQNDLKIGTFDMTKYIINDGNYSDDYITTLNYRMNLDINFFSNYRESIGDYKTAEWCYRYVIDKYPDHAMAYYCLGRVLEKQKDNNKIMESDFMYSTAINIIEKDYTWKSHFDYFNIKI